MTMNNANGTVGRNSMGQHQTRQRRRRAQQGTTLLEVMVVLVVLLVGIFLAIRVFPTGFGILQSNSNKTAASQFAQQTMGQIQGDAVNLPQGVLLSYIGDDGALHFKTDEDPDDLSQLRLDPNTVPARNPYFADINKFRFIKGESVKVPLPSQTTFGSGSIYTCKFGPLYMSQAAGDPNTPPTNAADQTYLQVYGAPLTGVPVTFDALNTDAVTSYIRDAQTYAIYYGDDNNGAQIALPPRPNATPARPNPSRRFIVTITYFDGSKYVTTQADPIDVPDNETTSWQPITVNNKAANPVILPGSEVVTRAFDRLAFNTAWDTNDPYQYKLISPNVTSKGGTPTIANVGILAFNPSGANYSEDTAYGQKAFTANLDYAVLDWHLLHDEREVPTAVGNPIPVRTTLNFIKRIGDPETDGTVYGGLFGSKTDDIQVFDLSRTDGKPLVPGDLTTKKPLTGTTPADYYLNLDEKSGSYRNGVIYIETTRVKPGTKLRILYRAEGDWGVALQKAFSFYSLAPDPKDTSKPSPFPLPGAYDKFAVAGTTNNAEIRLPLADFNKSVLVTLQYTVTDSTTHKDVVKRVGPIQMVASGSVLTDIPNQDPLYDARYSFIRVRDFLPFYLKDNPATLTTPNDGEFSQATSWSVVGALTGVSAKARVIWRDADAPTTRWRVQDIDTYITQAPK